MIHSRSSVLASHQHRSGWQCISLSHSPYTAAEGTMRAPLQANGCRRLRNGTCVMGIPAIWASVQSCSTLKEQDVTFLASHTVHPIVLQM